MTTRGRKNRSSPTTREIEDRKALFKPETVHIREAAIDTGSLDENSRTLELSFSSEAPVRRYDWWNDRYYDEILGHAAGNVNLERLNGMGVLLFNHQPGDVHNVVGRIESAWLDEADRKCRARVAFDSDDSSELVFQKVRSGTLKGVSVGYCVTRWEQVDEGVETSDGFKGPAAIAREWEAYEISVAPVPADVTVGFGRSMDQNNEGSASILDEKEKDNKTTETAAIQPVESAATESGAGVEEERARATEIVELCRSFGIEPDAYLKDGATVDYVRKAILAKIADERKPLKTDTAPASATVNRDEREVFVRRVAHGLALKEGIKVAKPEDGAEEFRGITLFELARLALERNGERVGYDEDRMEVARRAFSTSDFPLILMHVAEASLKNGYDESPVTYASWTRKGALNDFKAATKLRLSEAPVLEKLSESGEYKMAAFTESEDNYKLETFGKGFSITRQAIVNDDLDAISRIPSLFGAAARRTVNRAVYTLLKTASTKYKPDNKALFHADHNNLAATGAALSIESLNAARTAMRRQKGMRDDVTLNLYPSFLIIPPELETLANQLLKSTADISQANPAVINPFQGSLTVVVDPELTDTKAWYLASSPGLVDTIEVAFLGGQDSPVLEQTDTRNVDGREWLVRLDFGVKAWDYRGLYKNPGA